MNGDQVTRKTQALARLAEDLVALPVGAPAQHCCNARWWFFVHRYEDGFTVLRDYELGPEWGVPFASPRDIGRFFADPLDFVNFILGDPSPRFVLEATDL